MTAPSSRLKSVIEYVTVPMSAVDAPEGRSRNAVLSQVSPGGLRDVAVSAPFNMMASILRSHASFVRGHGVLVAFVEIVLRCYSDRTARTSHRRQNAEPRRVLCACTKCAPSEGVLGDSTASHGDDTAFLLRCERLYRVHLGVLQIF